ARRRAGWRPLGQRRGSARGGRRLRDGRHLRALLLRRGGGRAPLLGGLRRLGVLWASERARVFFERGAIQLRGKAGVGARAIGGRVARRKSGPGCELTRLEEAEAQD